MIKFTPTIKGLLTGIAMIIAGLSLFYSNTEPASPLMFVSYFLYGLGIVWAIVPFAKQFPASTFGKFFNQGFKCFIVVTLMMAVYTFVFYKSNPKLVEEKGELTRQELLKTEKNRTPAEINTMIENGKKNFAVLATSVTIFQYLLVGAIVSAATAGILSLSNKNQ